MRHTRAGAYPLKSQRKGCNKCRVVHARSVQNIALREQSEGMLAAFVHTIAEDGANAADINHALARVLHGVRGPAGSVLSSPSRSRVSMAWSTLGQGLGTHVLRARMFCIYYQYLSIISAVIMYE